MAAARRSGCSPVTEQLGRLASPSSLRWLGRAAVQRRGSSAAAQCVFFDLLLIQKLLKTDVNLEQLLRCPTCGSAGNSAAPLVLDGPAKLRRACGPDHTYYNHSSKYCHKKCPGQPCFCQSAARQPGAPCQVRLLCTTAMPAASVLPSYRCASLVYTGKANPETGIRGATSFDSKHPSVQAALPAWVKAILPVVFNAVRRCRQAAAAAGDRGLATRRASCPSVPPPAAAWAAAAQCAAARLSVSSRA